MQDTIQKVLSHDAKKICARLEKHFPAAHCELEFSSPLELFVATILSAQCTDKQVNRVLPALFARCNSAQDFAKIPRDELEKLIHATGFFRRKAQHIQEACQILATRFGGEIPQDLELLISLPGVGRKTANVVLGAGFGIASGIVVDTHVSRITKRLGFSQAKSAEAIEQDLLKIIPQNKWILISHLLIQLGRTFCKARAPQCAKCPIQRECNYSAKTF